MSIAAALAVQILVGMGYPDRPIEQLEAIMPPVEHWGPPTVPYIVHHEMILPLYTKGHSAMTLPFLVGGVCHIWINPYLFEMNRLGYAVTLFHEWAHCPEAGSVWMSWPGNHPGEGTVDVDVEVMFAPWLDAWEAEGSPAAVR